MALTWREKRELTNKLIEFITSELANTNQVSYTNRQLREIMDINCSPQAMTGLINEMRENLENVYIICDTNKIDNICHYNFFKPDYTITGKMRKDKNLLYFDTTKENQYITYNFITKEWSVSIDGIYVQYKEWFEEIQNLLNYEWVFNYLDLEKIYEVREIAHYARLYPYMYEKCPKNLISYINETGVSFSHSVVRKLYNLEKYGFIGMNLIDSFNEETVKTLIDYGVIKNFLNTIVNDVKKGIIECGNSTYCQLATKFIMILNIKNNYRLDENKSCKANLEMIENILDEEKNTVLAHQLQKLNFINHLQKKGLEVIVPQNQMDKKTEGEMQHNCVGYYYDDSIISGLNLIYFIRKANNINKSYITCRYSTKYKATVEYRGFSNNAVKDNNAIIFIKELDEIIKANLK